MACLTKQQLDYIARETALSFINRDCDGGMGYIVLNHCKSLSSQLDKENTIYEVRCLFDLNGESVTVPSGCVLKFDGGMFINGALVGNETRIEYKGCIFSGITIGGTWNVPEINSKMFADCTDTDVLKSLFALQNADIYNRIVVEKVEESYSVKYVTTNILVVKSNADVIIDGTISLEPNNAVGYNIVHVAGENVHISGSGKIVGDLDNHTFVPESTSEQGHGIRIFSGSKNITIEGLEICKCIGDGIYQKSSCKDVIIRNVHIHHCRRQGITVQGIENIIIENFNIHDISGTDPQSGIDIEPNREDGEVTCEGIIIRNGIIDTCRLGIQNVDNQSASWTYKDIIIENVKIFNASQPGIVVQRYTTGAKIVNCDVNSKVFGVSVQYCDATIDNCKINTEEVDVGQEDYRGVNIFQIGTQTVVRNCRLSGYNAVRTMQGLDIQHCIIVTSAGLCYNLGGASGSGSIINSNITCATNIQTKTPLLMRNNTISCKAILLGGNSIVEQNVLTGSATSATKSFIGPDSESGQKLTVKDNIISVPDNIYRYIIELLNNTKSVVYGNNITGHNTDGRFIGPVNGNYAINFSGYAGSGSSASRPVFLNNVHDDSLIGICYYDSTLEKPIWHKGNNVWIDATGTIV